jgi:hypothetical protein
VRRSLAVSIRTGQSRSATWAEDGRPQGARPQDPPAAGRRVIGGVRKWATPAATTYPGSPPAAVEGVRGLRSSVSPTRSGVLRLKQVDQARLTGQLPRRR